MSRAMKNTYVLNLSCPDKPGIVHGVSGLLLQHGANIEEAAQHNDPQTGLFTWTPASDQQIEAYAIVRVDPIPAVVLTLFLEALAELPPAQAQPRWEKLYQIEWEIAKTTQAQPGAGELLERLRSLHDSRIGILTRNSKSIAHATLAACGLLEFFEPEAILSRDCCAPKPQPDGILQILHCWDATPDRGVMVGDYIFDLLAGRNAGTATVHLDVTGSFTWPEHTDCGITQLAELSRLLD